MFILKNSKLPRIGKVPLYAIIVVFVFMLAVLQDFIFSQVQNTGFYWSETLLYNSFWVFIIPFTLLANHLVSTFNPKIKWLRMVFNLGTGLSISLLHILVFTSFFVFVSFLVFSPAHRFSAIFHAALSNQFYIILIWYTIFPAVYSFISQEPDKETVYPQSIKLKIGSTIKSIPISSIQFIATDKPYSTVVTIDQKFLDSKSLKEFESELDPALFMRVHRSTIINFTFIKELNSRSNGDYDARLKNGQTIRLSRHYRKNWEQLLH